MYTIVTTRSPRGFHVKDAEGTVLAEMRQPKLFAQNMEGTVEGRAVQLIAEGFWRMRYAVLVDATRIGTVRTTGWGRLVWKLAFHGAPVEIEFAQELWRHRYQVRLAKDLPLLDVKPVFRWSSFNTDYEVTVTGSGIAPDQMALMLALVGFSARLKQAYAQAGAGT